uniref:Uncharacterized protein n=1 Tax=Triticum urartu TaxID=4572 RepID=A0A8R7TSJ6_TRIUA
MAAAAAFSIREYAASVRGKPAAEGRRLLGIEDLPPLGAPRCRWWADELASTVAAAAAAASARRAPGKARPPKKRSISDLFAAAPPLPVPSAGDTGCKEQTEVDGDEALCAIARRAKEEKKRKRKLQEEEGQKEETAAVDAAPESSRGREPEGNFAARKEALENPNLFDGLDTNSVKDTMIMSVSPCALPDHTFQDSFRQHQSWSSTSGKFSSWPSHESNVSHSKELKSRSELNTPRENGPCTGLTVRLMGKDLPVCTTRAESISETAQKHTGYFMLQHIMQAQVRHGLHMITATLFQQLMYFLEISCHMKTGFLIFQTRGPIGLFYWGAHLLPIVAVEHSNRIPRRAVITLILSLG